MKKILLALVALMLSLTAFAQINPNAPMQRDPSVLYGKLDNGLTYYIMHNEKPAQRAEYYLFTNVGAVQESPEQDGLAHFLEHMCLNGTQNLPDKTVIDYFESIGAKFGANINASTGSEQTMYMLNNIPTTREGIIDTALLTMHDYAGFVTNDPVEIDKERGVIIEEWRTRRNAQWRMMEKQFTYLYKGSKLATTTIIGSKDNLETFPPEELVKFYKKWYRPDLQAIVVVGDIDPQAILAKITDLWKDIPAPEGENPKTPNVVPDNVEPIVGIITDPEAQSTSVTAIVKSQPLPLPYRQVGAGFMIDLMQDLINSMFEERLDDIASRSDAPFFSGSIGYTSVAQNLDGLLMAAGCKDGEGLTAFKAALTELEKARRFGFTEAEFERAKTRQINAAERFASNADSRKNSELIGQFQSDFFYGWPFLAPAYREEQLKGYLDVITVAQLNQIIAAEDYSKNMVIIYKAPEKEGLVHPTEAELAAAVSEVASSEIESNQAEEEYGELVDASALKGSKVKKTAKGLYGSTVWTLKNGIRVTVRPSDFKKEEVLVKVRALGGQSLIEDEDLVSLDNNMRSLYSTLAGVSSFPRTTLLKMLAGKTVSWSPSIDELEHGVVGSCAPKDFETLMQLIYLQVTDPRFDAEELAPGLAQLNAVLPNIEKTPSYRYSVEYYKTAYGNNPRRELISSDKLSKLSYESFEKSYRKLFANMAKAEVIICGNVDMETIKPLVEKYIGSLPVAKKATSFIDRKDDVVPGQIDNYFTCPMETPKTTCMFIVSGDAAKGNLSDRIHMKAISSILDIIYTATIREDEGGTYGVGTQGSVTSIPTPRSELLIQFDTDPAKADAMIALALDGLRSIAEKGPDAAMVEKVKGNMLKLIPEQRITNSYWYNKLGSYYNTGLDLDTDMEKEIESLSVESVQKAAADLLSQGNMIKVVMNPEK